MLVSDMAMPLALAIIGQAAIGKIERPARLEGCRVGKGCKTSRLIAPGCLLNAADNIQIRGAVGWALAVDVERASWVDG
jgi:hypothetical protein